MIRIGPGRGHGKGDEGSPTPPQLHPDRDPGNPALHSRFVELSEAYQVLSREESRRSYDHQLRSATSPKSPGTAVYPRSAHRAHRYSSPAPSLPRPSLTRRLFPTFSLLPPNSSWEDPSARYWAQFPGVRPQGPESRRQQQKHNQRTLGYCLLIMLAGMCLHYVAFRCASPWADGQRAGGWAKPSVRHPPTLSLWPAFLCFSS